MPRRKVILCLCSTDSLREGTAGDEEGVGGGGKFMIGAVSLRLNIFKMAKKGCRDEKSLYTPVARTS